MTDPSEHAAELMAAYRPRCPIIAISSDVKSARNLRLYRGILPAIYEAPPKEDWSDEMDSRIAFAIDFAWDRLVICAGSQVRYRMLIGWPIPASRPFCIKDSSQLAVLFGWTLVDEVKADVVPKGCWFNHSYPRCKIIWLFCEVVQWCSTHLL